MRSRNAESRTAHDFLSLAEWYDAYGRDHDAVSRAEEGLRLFGAEDTAGLRDFLISAYERTGQTSLARELVWQQFIRLGGESGYRRLREHFLLTAADEWPACRKRAFEHLRERLARESATAREQHRSHPPDGRHPRGNPA